MKADFFIFKECFKAGESFRSFIGRVIIDDNDFKKAARVFKQAIEKSLGVKVLIKNRSDDRDLHDLH
jgi:hypothetical protein